MLFSVLNILRLLQLVFNIRRCPFVKIVTRFPRTEYPPFCIYFYHVFVRRYPVLWILRVVNRTFRLTESFGIFRLKYNETGVCGLFSAIGDK